MVIIHLYFLLEIQCNSLILYIPKKEIQELILKMLICFGTFYLKFQNLLIKSLFFSLIEVLLMVILIWMVMDLILIDGLMNKVKPIGLNSILKLIKVLKISLVMKLMIWKVKIQILLQNIYLMKSNKVKKYHGDSVYK